VSIIEDQLLDKPPQGLPVSMHQDYAYWRFSSSMETVSCWISLMEDVVNCGGLTIVSGSHRFGLATKPEKLIEGSEEQWLSVPASIRSSSEGELELVEIDVPKGGGVFFHGLTVHGSPRNPSRITRRGPECIRHTRWRPRPDNFMNPACAGKWIDP